MTNTSLVTGVMFLYMYTDHSGVSKGTNASAAYLFVSLGGAGLLIRPDLIRAVSRNPHVPLALCGKANPTL